MKSLIKTLALVITAVMMFSSTVFAAVPSDTVVIGDKAYSIDYIVLTATEAEINAQLANFPGAKIFYNIEGQTTDFTGLFDEELATSEELAAFPQITYVKSDGTTVIYEAGNGDEVTADDWLTVSSVSDITATTVDVTFPALTEAITDASVEVKDGTGAVVAVVPQDFQVGETGATFVFSTPRLVAPTGIWTVNGVSFNTDAIAQLATINAAVVAGNQITTLAALKAAGLVNVIDANIIAYMGALTPAPTTLVEAQTAITVANKTVTDAVVVKAVVDSTNQTTLLAALQNIALARVNPDWIVAYQTAITAATAITIDSTVVDVQAKVDGVNSTGIATANTDATTVATQNAVTDLISNYTIADVAPAHVKADAIKTSQIKSAVFGVEEATTAATVYNALVALSALDSTNLPATSLNVNLKADYLAAKTLATIDGTTAVAALKMAVVTAADTSALAAAATGIVNLTILPTASTTADVKAALQKLADVTSHTTDKFDMTKVYDASLGAYLVALENVIIPTANDVTLIIAGVNSVGNQAVYLNTIKTSTSVTAVSDALTGIALGTVSTSTTAYINASSSLKLEIAQFILTNQADLVTTTSATITAVVTAPAVPTYETNALEKAIVDQAAKVASFNGIGNLAAATISTTNIALTAYAYAPYLALTDVQKLAVAEHINGLTKMAGDPLVATPLNFITGQPDAVKTIAQANAIIDAAIAAK